jgi:protein DGCR14
MPDETSQAVAKRSAESALMPPPPPPKRQKRPAIILNEDEYSQAVSNIIARDYFPGLSELQAQTEYMEALESNDRQWIRESGRRLTQAMTPQPRRRGLARDVSSSTPHASMMGDTPRGFVGETPGQTPRRSAAQSAESMVDTDMSLTAFQAKYTSEDNESFNAILDKQNHERAQKYSFFHTGNKIAPSRQLVHRTARSTLLLGQGVLDARHPALAAACNSKDAASETPRPSQDLDLRPASLDSFPNKQGARNHFMFGPEGVTGQELVSTTSGNPSYSSQKTVIYGNTRLHSALAPAQQIPASPSMSAIDAAIAGRPAPTESDPGYSGAETPRVNGYAFVDSEPTPSEYGQPVEEEDVAAAERAALTRLLPKLDSTGESKFRMTENSSRETTHRRLVEKADSGRRSGNRLERLRDLGITPGRSATPKFVSSPLRKAHILTPAARRLAGTITTPRRATGIFGTHHKDWTPNPRARKPG